MGVWDAGRTPSFLPTQTTEFDENARALLNGKPAFDDSSPRFEDWSPEKQRASYEGLQRADETRTIKSHNADEFVSLHSEFLDTPKNAQLITKMLKNLFGDVAYSVEQYEAAYQSLLITDSLDIDKAEVAKQQQKAADAKRKAALKNRADAASRMFNPNSEYETLSIEELRNRANEELQFAGGGAGAAGF